MIFFGDFASYRKSLKINFQKDYLGATILLNCEGYLVEDAGVHNTVFNNIKLFKDLSNNYDIVLNLSNNHTMDVDNGVAQSLKLAQSNNLQTVGAGLVLNEAERPLIKIINGIEVAIISGGWDVIGCKYASNNSQGVAPLDSKYLLNQISTQKKLGRKIAIYLHWSYELEVYPQPTHRELARRCIDAGADIILGCHSHCLQGFEKYNQKYIFYGLGNTVFDENYFFDGKLSFPVLCKTGLAVDWEPVSGQVLVTTTTYENNILVVSDFVEPESLRVINKLSEFSNMNSQEYLEFFKKNRRKKNLLPIFSETDTSMIYHVKRHFLFFRAKVIKKMFVLGIKGGSK